MPSEESALARPVGGMDTPPRTRSPPHLTPAGRSPPSSSPPRARWPPHPHTAAGAGVTNRMGGAALATCLFYGRGAPTLSKASAREARQQRLGGC